MRLQDRLLAGYVDVQLRCAIRPRVYDVTEYVHIASLFAGILAQLNSLDARVYERAFSALSNTRRDIFQDS